MRVSRRHIAAQWIFPAFLVLLMPSLSILAAPALPDFLSGEVLRGSFVQERHLKGFATPLRSSGHFVLAPGRGLIWRVETPFAVTTVINGSGLVQLVAGSETMRLSAARIPFLSHLYGMLGGALGGDWRTLEGDFLLDRQEDAHRWRIHLTPRRSDDNFSVPFASVTAQGGRFIDLVEMSKPDGDADILHFDGQSLTTAKLPADEAALLSLLDK